MNREITFYIAEIDKIYVTSDTFNGYYTGRRLYAGQSGENEATRLTFTFGIDFIGYAATVYFDGTEATTHTLADGDLEFTYDIPDEYMLPEVIKMVIEIELGDQMFKSRQINLEVER